MDVAGPPIRFDAPENREMLQLAQHNATHRWWGPATVLVVAVVLFGAATLLMRRKRRGGVPLRTAAMALGGVSVIVMTMFATNPYIEKPEIPAAAVYVGTGCSDYSFDGTPLLHGTFGGSSLRIPIGDPTLLNVVNYRRWTCHYRIPALGVDLSIPPGELRYAILKVDEPMTAHVFLTGGQVEQERLLRVVSSEDLFQDFLDERVHNKRSHHPDWGAEMYTTKDCNQCHAIASAGVLAGPSFVDLYGSVVELSDGTKSVVDPDFIQWAVFSRQRPRDVRFAPVNHDFHYELRQPGPGGRDGESLRRAPPRAAARESCPCSGDLPGSPFGGIGARAT